MLRGKHNLGPNNKSLHVVHCATLLFRYRMQIDFARDPLLIRSVIKLEGRIVSLTPAALVFLALATSCFIISSLCLSKEVGEVNRKLPDDQQISYWGMYTSKRLKIKDQYRKLYPNGRLDRVVFLWEIAGFILVFFSAMSSGLFDR
jgi:hypothetical protein